MKKLGIPLTSVDLSVNDGTPWWLLTMQAHPGTNDQHHVDVLATISPCNISETDVFTFAAISQRHVANAKIGEAHSSEWISSFLNTPRTNSFGSMLRNLKLHEIDGLFDAELGASEARCVLHK